MASKYIKIVQSRPNALKHIQKYGQISIRISINTNNTQATIANNNINNNKFMEWNKNNFENQGINI